MNNKLRIALGLLLLLALAYLGYANYPRARTEYVVVMKTVIETRKKPFTTTAIVDGQSREVTVEIPYKLHAKIPEEDTVDILPTVKEYFRFGTLCFAALAMLWYIAIVLIAVRRIKKAGDKATASSRDTERKADAIVTFVFGLIVGFFGAGGELVKKPDGVPPDKLPEPQLEGEIPASHAPDVA